MDNTNFIEQIKARDDLSILQIDEGEGAIIVRYVPTQTDYVILNEAIAKHDWDVIISILTGQREPRVLMHMTRICGYYSNVENWNKSKIGELRGRHNGDYAIDEVLTSPTDAPDCDGETCKI